MLLVKESEVRRQLFSTAFLLIVLTSGSLSAEIFHVGLIEAGVPPFIMPKGSESKGIYLEILDAAFKITGDTYEVHYAPAARVIEWFGEGRVDLEPGINPLWRSNQSRVSVYTGSFMTYATCAFRRKPASGRVISVEDLVGQRVGMIRGYSYPGWDDARIIRDDSLNDDQLMAKLKAGRFETCYAGMIPGAYAAQKMGLDVEVVKVLYSLDIAFRLRKERAEALARINAALGVLERTGTIQRIIRSYVQLPD